MADRAAFPAVSKLNDRDRAVLRYVARRSHGTRRQVPLSRRDIAEATGLTYDQIARACRSLDRLGLLDVAERYRQDGGRAENGYALTEAALRSMP